MLLVIIATRGGGVVGYLEINLKPELASANWVNTGHCKVSNDDTRDWPNICPITAPYLQSGGSWIRDPTNQPKSSLLIEILVISGYIIYAVYCSQICYCYGITFNLLKIWQPASEECWFCTFRSRLRYLIDIYLSLNSCHFIEVIWHLRNVCNSCLVSPILCTFCQIHLGTRNFPLQIESHALEGGQINWSRGCSNI